MKSDPEVVFEKAAPFVAAARKYIALIDTLERYTLHDFLIGCATHLPELYRLGIQLPDVVAEETGEVVQYNPEDPRTKKALEEHSDRYANIAARVDALLGKHTLYALVFDPVSDTDIVNATLGDDLADLYCDLLEELADYEADQLERRLSAIWEWKFTMQLHAGPHIVNALRPIHWLLFNHMPWDAGADKSPGTDESS